MAENEEKNNQALMFAGAGTAIGTISAAVAGTALAAPAAIGGGVALIIWGVIKLVGDNKSEK